MAYIKKIFPMKTLIENTRADSGKIYTGEITDDVQIIVDTGSKMFECWVNLFELELAWFEKDPRLVPLSRADQEWKNDPSFLKQMVLNNLEITEEIEP